MKTFISKHWDGKRGDYTCTPFRKASTNPDPENFRECDESELGTASKQYREGDVEVWGWL